METLKAALIVFLVFSGFSSADCQNPSPKNKVKSIVVLSEKSDVLVKKQYKESETYYDYHGNVIEEINYKQGKVDKHFRYQYNSDDNKVKEEKLDPAGRVIETSEYRYENGLRVQKIVYDGNMKVKSKKSYQYTTF
jgi:hypothetical protein